MEIYYDGIQEGAWFQMLHPRLYSASLLPFPSSRKIPSVLKDALSYDRPDIILIDNGLPVLVLERTTEVPSGHNVGQRFARLVAAAQMRVPVVYFGPYAAYKHGGETQGPRYMNLRLFYALKKLAEIEKTAVTIINWPVDHRYEVIQTPEKDERVKDYLELFFALYDKHGLSGMIDHVMQSTFEREQEAERQQFISTQVARPHEYDSPPDSVKIGPHTSIIELVSENPNNLVCEETVFYNVGMNYIRSDPYTGMSLLYAYLYCGGMTNCVRNLVLWFPNITKGMWYAVSSGERKDVRIFRLVADGILFEDGYLPKDSL